MPGFLRMPELEEDHRADNGSQRSDDVRKQRGGNRRIGGDELGNGKRAATDKTGRPNFPTLFPASHDDDQIERDEDADQGQGAADHLAQCKVGNARDLTTDDDRNADGAPGDGCRIGQQTDTRCIKRIEAKAGQHCSRNRHWRAESGCTFNEGAEGKGNQ